MTYDILDDYASGRPASLTLLARDAAPLCGPDNGLWHQFSVQGDVHDLAQAIAWLDDNGLLGSRWRAVYDASDTAGIDLLVSQD